MLPAFVLHASVTAILCMFVLLTCKINQSTITRVQKKQLFYESIYFYFKFVNYGSKFKYKQ